MSADEKPSPNRPVDVSDGGLGVILSLVQVQLERPRVLSLQVAGAIGAQLGVDDPLEGLDRECWCHWAPDEVGALFAPLFTPDFSDREVCESALPPVGLDPAAVASLVTTLGARSLECPLVFGEQERPLPLDEGVIERYVRLLHLDAAIHPLLWQTMEGLVAEGAPLPLNEQARCVLFSRARASVWSGDAGRAALLGRYLTVVAEKGTFRADKVVFLTEFMRSYRPSDEAKLIQALHNLVEAYHQDGDHPVYNPRLQHHQRSSIRSQYCGPAVKAFRLTMARDLLADFGHVAAPP